MLQWPADRFVSNARPVECRLNLTSGQREEFVAAAVLGLVANADDYYDELAGRQWHCLLNVLAG